MTGKNSEKTGFNYLAHYCYDKFLEDSHKFMPAYYKEFGYKTLHVGKWHMGFAKWSQTPTARGFDQSYLGLGGYMSFWDFAAASPPMCMNENKIHIARAKV
jgi:arylsulfatase A-like enzyme